MSAKQSGRRLRSKGCAVLIVILGLSVGLNIWGMVHYRLPGPLWRALQHRGETLPPLAMTPHGLTLPAAQLGFSSAVKSTSDIEAWQRSGRTKLRELLGVELST